MAEITLSIIGGALDLSIEELGANIIVRIKDNDDEGKAIYLLPRIQDKDLAKFFTHGIRNLSKQIGSDNSKNQVIFRYYESLDLYLGQRGIKGDIGMIRGSEAITFQVDFICPVWDFKTVILKPATVYANDVLKLNSIWKDPVAPFNPERFFFRTYPE